MAFKLKSLYGMFGEVTENIGGLMGTQVIEEIENEYKIVCHNCFYHVESLNTNIHTAELYIYDTDSKDYMLSDILYLFFDAYKNKMVYSEQGSSLNVSVYNYCKFVLKKEDITMKEVDELACVYQLDEGEALKKYSSYNILKN